MSSSESSKATPWLSPGLVLNILRKCEHDDGIQVLSVSSKSATVDGDNYMSDISRINVAFTRGHPDNNAIEQKTLIFKVSLNKNTAAHDVSREAEVFETEIEMMQNTLVKMNEILDEKDCPLNARVFHAQVGDPSFLVLEDLGARGFRLANRQLGLDRDHCILVMRKLAKFHASSVALYEKDPSCIKHYRRGIYHKNCPQPIQNFTKEVFKQLSSEVKNWPGLDSSYSEKLLKLADVCFEKTVKSAAFKEQEFNVLNHGDAWINNLMFRYDEEGKVVDQIFLDFQICFWSSPAYDLIYLFYSNPNDVVYVHHFDELVAEYLKTLSSTMSRIKCRTKPPSLESIRRVMREREFLGVLTSIVTIPFQLIDASEVMNLSELLVQPKPENRSPGMKDERFRRIITRRLKEWNSRGLLDI